MPLQILHVAAPCRNVPVTFTLDLMLDVPAYFRSISVGGLLATLFFGAQWLALPKDVSKSSAHVSRAEARYMNSKWPQVQFLRDDGVVEQVSCGRVRRLCESTKASSIRDLTVWTRPTVFGEEPWVVAVEAGEQVLLSEVEQRAAFADFKTKSAMIACGFLLFSIVALALAFWLKRNARPNSSFQRIASGGR